MPAPDRKIARRRLLTGSAAAIGAPLIGGTSAPAHAANPSRRPASLEPDEKRYVELDADFLKTQTAHYPRIKRMRDGRFLLLYQTSQHSWNVYRAISRDLKQWTEPQLLFASHKILDGADDRCYATADARVLDNGEILTVCSFRANQRFSTHMELDGLMMRRSADHGATWGPGQVIYVGANWEPFVHQTPTGEVQVYFTHSAPKRVIENTVGSTGVAIIRSLDRGRTWTPDVTDHPYAADRVAQQYVRTSDTGVKIFTDQMPSALQTHPQGGIALAMESKLVDGYRISFAYTRQNWPDRLGLNEPGPADRQDNVFRGAGPYLARFPSGETVLAYNRDSRQHLHLGDHSAREFGDAQIFLPGNGFWGSIEVAGPRQLITTMANVRPDGNKIMIGVLDLIRR